MGDAENRILCNYNKFKKIKIKINNNRELEYVRKPRWKTTEYSFLSNTCRTYIKKLSFAELYFISNFRGLNSYNLFF